MLVEARPVPLKRAGDTDWFKITLVAGKTYQFDALGGTLADTYLRLRDSAGTSITFDDDGGAGLNSRITFTATSGGTYFLSAGSATSSGIGTYTVSAADVTVIADDYLASTSTTGTVSVGGSKTGSIGTTGDTDWFKITLVAEKPTNSTPWEGRLRTRTSGCATALALL